MSTLPSPSPSAHASGYAIPNYPYTTTVSFSSSLPMTTPKPKVPKVNVFSNDGSFLERFHKLKRDELEKKKQEETLQRKRNFDSRFKNRGKRPPVTVTPSSSSVTSSDGDDSRPPKRLRSESSGRST